MNKHFNYKKHIRKVRIHKHYLVMHQLYQQLVFLDIGFDIKIINMYSKYSSILNNSDIADNKDQPIS